MSANLQAFLDMLGVSEGTSTCPATQDRGYDILVGGTRFTSYADHPRIVVDLGHGLKSTAAGKFQILERYYDAYADSLDLDDFSPDSQDAIAVEMIRERHAIEPIEEGNLMLAIHLCCNIWASLPGSLYRQHIQPYALLEKAYLDAGGKLRAS